MKALNKHIIRTTQHYDNHLDIIGGMHYIVVTVTLLEHLYCGCTSCGHIHTNYGEDWRGKLLSRSYFVCSYLLEFEHLICVSRVINSMTDERRQMHVRKLTIL